MEKLVSMTIQESSYSNSDLSKKNIQEAGLLNADDNQLIVRIEKTMPKMT
jgi:hypothetical protein